MKSSPLTILILVFPRSSCEDSAIPTGGQPIAEPQYAKGEYVYIQAKKGARPEPSILLVERVWNTADDVPMVHGNCFFRYDFFLMSVCVQDIVYLLVLNCEDISFSPFPAMKSWVFPHVQLWGHVFFPCPAVRTSHFPHVQL